MKKLSAAKETSGPVSLEADLDEDLRSLTDGIAQLGRFEAQLAEFELELLSDGAA